MEWTTGIDLLTVGEAFQDLIFVGLPHMPRVGEELRTQQFVSTMGGGALITATAESRLGLRTEQDGEQKAMWLAIQKYLSEQTK